MADVLYTYVLRRYPVNKISVPIPNSTSIRMITTVPISGLYIDQPVSFKDFFLFGWKRRRS